MSDLNPFFGYVKGKTALAVSQVPKDSFFLRFLHGVPDFFFIAFWRGGSPAMT